MTTTSLLVRAMRPAEREAVRNLVRAAFAGYADAFAPRLPNTWAWVRAAAVAPDRLRGGVASALLAECERLAAAGGATAIGLHTTAFMTATHRLAARHGFRRAPAGDLDGGVHFGHDEDDLRVLAYAKDLR
jgi:GNAT superfamily N-acetyltransferase